jgi:hypothetical protein
LENIYFTPRRALRAHLAGLRDILRNVDPLSDTANAIPKDPHTLSSLFNLDAVTRPFLSCPKCHHIFPYRPSDLSTQGDPAISHCAHRQTPSSPLCGTPLWERRAIYGGITKLAPKKIYLHHDLKSWLGRLLSRKGIEDLLDSQPHVPSMDPNASVNDIWLSKVFLNLKDSAGLRFYPGPAGEGRLIFSFAMDSFNTFGMKTAKQQVSSTGMWLVCLNFPEHLRFLQENMFLVGVIPGPDKPSKEQINPYLQLVVEDLLEFWTPGVFFSRTYRHQLGKLYKAMLIPVISDMLALRQALGLAAPTAHYFCTFCDLDIDDIEVLDKAEWPSKNLTHIRRFAELWRDATSERDRENIFNACGLRWSPLLNLPYFNPVLYAIVDSMHVLENLHDIHVREYFQINLEVDHGGDGLTEAPLTPEKCVSRTDSGLKRCQKLVRLNEPRMLYELLSLRRKILYTFCVDNKIQGEGHKLIVGTKWVLATNIFRWVCLHVLEVRLLTETGNSRCSDKEPTMWT